MVVMISPMMIGSDHSYWDPPQVVNRIRLVAATIMKKVPR